MTILALLNDCYATIEEMAGSQKRVQLAWARRAYMYLLNVHRPYTRRRVQLGIFTLLATLVFNLFTVIPVAHASGETYTWDSKTYLKMAGGALADRNITDPTWGVDYIAAKDSITAGFSVKLKSGCSVTVTMTNFSADHKTAKVDGTTILGGTAGTFCAANAGDVLDGTVTIGNTAVFNDTSPPPATIPAGCPGNPGPVEPDKSYPCPGGGSVVGGTYYPDANTGRINGKVTLTADCKDASCGCGNATVNVTRLSGASSGDTTTKTGGDGTFSLQLAAGDVKLSTPDCHKKSDGSIWSGSSAVATVKANGIIIVNFVASTAGSGAVSSDAVCDNADFTELNFWVCGLINLLSSTITSLDSAILEQLKIDTDTIFNDNGTSKASNGYFLAWAAFRNIAYAILVIFALFMIMSQILGMDFVDAYTLRKLLPRLIIGSILIALSWNGLDFLFNLSNDAADAVRAIIAAPFHNISVTIGSTVTNDISLAVIVPLLLTIGVPAGVAALALMGVGGIAALIASIALAVFSAWFILVARNVVADLLIIISPIAIILWTFDR